MKRFKPVKRIMSNSTSVDKYYNEVNKIRSITPDEEYELTLKAQNGDVKAKNRLIEANLRFVISVAKSYVRSTASLEDLISEGNVGLVEAIDKFDPSTGFKFISYAVWHIRRNILEYLSNKSRMIRLPYGQVQSLFKINEAINNVRGAEELEPTIDMIVQELDKMGKPMTEEVVLRIINTDAGHKPLECDGADTISPIDIIPSKEYNPLESVYVNDFDNIKSKLFKKLNTQEQFILTKRIGLNGDEPESFDNIAKYLDISGTTVNTKYRSIIRKLKRESAKIKYTP